MWSGDAVTALAVLPHVGRVRYHRRSPLPRALPASGRPEPDELVARREVVDRVESVPALLDVALRAAVEATVTHHRGHLLVDLRPAFVTNQAVWTRILTNPVGNHRGRTVERAALATRLDRGVTVGLGSRVGLER
jgi:hypothetical protein